jgi:hypothetical protein
VDRRYAEFLSSQLTGAWNEQRDSPFLSRLDMSCHHSPVLLPKETVTLYDFLFHFSPLFSQRERCSSLVFAHGSITWD